MHNDGEKAQVSFLWQLHRLAHSCGQSSRRIAEYMLQVYIFMSLSTKFAGMQKAPKDWPEGLAHSSPKLKPQLPDFHMWDVGKQESGRRQGVANPGYVESSKSGSSMPRSVSKNYTSIDPKQLQNDSFRPISVKNRFLGTPYFHRKSKLLFVRPHSSPVSRATETSHRVPGCGQDKDKRRTRPGHRAGPQSPATEFRGAAKTRTRGGQQEEDNKRTRPSHRAQHRGQEEDKNSNPSIAHEHARARPALSLSLSLSLSVSLSFSLHAL